MQAASSRSPSSLLRRCRGPAGWVSPVRGQQDGELDVLDRGPASTIPVGMSPVRMSFPPHLYLMSSVSIHDRLPRRPCCGSSLGIGTDRSPQPAGP